MACKFYIARHGMTADDTSENDKVTGWMDIGINAEGRENAASAGRFLKSKGITSITASDLKRTLQTAKIIGDSLGLPVIESEKLRSWNMGAMQGMYVEAAKPFLTFFEKQPKVTPPKGEPFQRFYNRFKGVWSATVSYTKKFPNAHPLLVTHSQNMDIVQWFINGIEPGKALEFGGGIAPGGIMEVRISDEGDISTRKLKVG